MAGTISVHSGKDATFAGQFYNGNSPVTIYTGSDTLTAVLWAGDDTPVLSTLTATWTDASLGKYQLAFVPADTSGLDAGRYQVRVTITADGKSIVGDQFDCDVIDSPGATTAPKVYCSYSDMLNYLDSLPRLKTNLSQAGFAEARGMARGEFEQVIQAHVTPWRYATMGSGSYSSWGYSGGRDKWVQDQLDADNLIVTPLVVKINALLSLAIVCEGQVSTNQEKETNYQRLGAQFRRRAEGEIACYTAEIDTNADGFGDYTVRCGIFDSR